MDSDGLRFGVVVATFIYGLRHGIDLDHLAAISDITGSQEKRSRSIMLATVYALGHALVVLILGAVAVAAGRRLPSGVDDAMEHVVGVSLLVLSGYVFYSLVRYGRDFRLRSRWMLLFDAVRRTFRWLTRQRAPQIVEIEHSHDGDEPGHDHAVLAAAGSETASTVSTTRTGVRRHRHVVVAPEDPFVTYGIGTAAAVGIIHGVGAETPTQVLLLVAAAGVGGTATGLVLLAVFVAGLLVSNTAVAVGTTIGFERGRRAPTIYVALAVITAVTSAIMGVLYVAGKAELLPSLFG
ncbi:MAG TPA: hypothetical protein VJ927_07125 [Actinomycetota bacterium]|nr:hypothetical protein [Actinomycetota bacterium]